MMNSLRLLAAKIDPAEIGITDPVKSADGAIGTVLTTVYTWAGIVAVLIIIVAGYLYVTSGGNSTQTKRAKDAILGSVIGLVVIIMAFVITQFVLGRF